MNYNDKILQLLAPEPNTFNRKQDVLTRSKFRKVTIRNYKHQLKIEFVYEYIQYSLSAYYSYNGRLTYYSLYDRTKNIWIARPNQCLPFSFCRILYKHYASFSSR